MCCQKERPLLRYGKELFGSIEKDATAVLNVGTDISKTFIPEEIADIASGRIFNYYNKRKSVIAFPFNLNTGGYAGRNRECFIMCTYCSCSSKRNPNV